MKKVLILGGVSFNSMIYLDDFILPQPHTCFGRRYHETIGSTGAGKALHLVKLGFDVTLYGLIGGDPLGQHIVSYLEDANVSFIYDIDPHGTERHFNLMNRDGQRISVILNSEKSEPKINLEKIDRLISQHDYIVLNIVHYCRATIPLIKNHHKEIWCDIHDYDGVNAYHDDFIDAADYVLMSSDAMQAYRPFMERQIEQGKRLVICTHGKRGATALTSDNRWIDIPIISAYPVQDTNGAGDGFFSGVLYGHAQGYPLGRCLRLGTVVAGLCVTQLELAHPGLSEAMVQEEYRKYYN